jgi:hypothetical protein
VDTHRLGQTVGLVIHKPSEEAGRIHDVVNGALS